MGFKPGQIVTLANQKGGCGKTTTAVAIAAGAATRGLKTCIVDLDAQCNVTSTLGFDQDELSRLGKYTVLDAFLRSRPAHELALPLEGRFDGNLSLVPGHRSLDQARARLEADLLTLKEDQTPFDQDDLRNDHRMRLARSLNTLRDDYDLIVIDTPPTLDFLLTAALIAADWYVIPVFASGYDLSGLSKLTATARKVRERANPRLRMLGVVQGNFDRSTILDSDVYDNLKGRFKERMCAATLGRAVKHREATVHSLTIYEHAPTSEAAKQCLALTDEILVRIAHSMAEASVTTPSEPVANAERVNG